VAVRNPVLATPITGMPNSASARAPPDLALGGTDHATHQQQASMIRRYIIWRNNHAYDERLRRVVARANVA
jgi:hypothetical protein